MRFVTYLSDGGPRLGSLREDRIVTIPGLDMLGLIESEPERRTRLQKATGMFVPVQGTRLLPPILNLRRNVFCVGLNYAAHAAESQRAKGEPVKMPAVPVFFTKATTSLNGPYDDIPLDAGATQKLDWEVELGVVIGRRGKNILRAEAMQYVFGYTVINDVSARDLQSSHQQFFKGKSLDGTCPMGPWIVTRDEVPDPHNLSIRCRVNDVVKQDSNTSDFIFDIPALIEWLSKGMTLLPGDVIATGTPSGVGFARTPPEFLQPGDIVECEVQGIGTIRNRVVAA